MDETAFLGANGNCLRSGDAVALRQLLTAHPELTRSARLPGGLRLLDGMLYRVLGHVKDDGVALDLCRVYLDCGADPNATHFTQSDCGWINYAAGRTVESVQLFLD